MKTNLDEVYNEIDSAYKGNGSLDVYSNSINEEIDSINRRINGCDKEIEAKGEKINTLIASVSNETNEKKKTAILQQIVDERNNVKAINDKKADLERQRSKCEKKQNNITGYSKHKNEIEKIKEYKKKIENRAGIVKFQIVEFENKITYLRDEINVINEDLANSSREMSFQKNLKDSLNKEISDLQKTNTKNMTDEEKNELFSKLKDKNEEIVYANNNYNNYVTKYNDAMNSRMEKQAEIDKLNKNIDKCNKELDNLKGMTGKCDLAWKTLFTNKDWNEIHRRSLENGKRFTKSNKEKTNEEPEKVEKKPNEDEQQYSIVKSNVANKNESLTEVKQPGLFDTIAAKLKSAYKRVKLYFFGDGTELTEAEMAEQEAEEKVKQELEEKTKRKAERDRLAAQRTAEIERIKAKKDAERGIGSQKDAFLEALRIRTDAKYAEEYNAKKEEESKAKKQNANEQVEGEKDEER